ncbi:hypothetical protein ACIQUG_08235 [Ensifer sp. NPDC090286]
MLRHVRIGAVGLESLVAISPGLAVLVPDTVIPGNDGNCLG